ncbi:MAG: hypothetical protein LUB61_07855 [Eggerthellaceae bacterium]|nr:hypothetical protein [Eggerthellaceae bacterium]
MKQIDEKAYDKVKKEHKDVLAEDEPFVLESSETDPEFPAMQEFEVDTGGPKGSKRKHPGLIWVCIAIAAVIVLCIVFAVIGDWFTPDEAEQISQAQEDEAIVPEDMGTASSNI